MLTSSPYAEVTARILAELGAGAAPWVKPWSATPGANVPCNAATGRRYSGCNVVLLWLTQGRWASPRFVTFKVGQDAFAVIREAMRGKDMVALGRVVISKREHVIALEPYEKGLVLISLSEIKSGHNGGAIRPGSASGEYGQPSGRRAIAAHPCSVTSVCGFRCSISCRTAADGKGAVPQARRHGQHIPSGLSRSPVPHIHSAMAIVVTSVDLEYP